MRQQKTITALPALLCAAALVAGLAGCDDDDDSNNNFFAAPIEEDIADGIAKLVPGGAYWTSSAEEQAQLETSELSLGNCSSQWGRTFAGIVPYSVPFYPAQNANYWFYSIVRDENGNVPTIRMTNPFPYARYMSFNMYDNNSGVAVQASAIRDADMQPDPANINPFVPGTNRNVADRDYSLWFVPEGEEDTLNRLKAEYGENNVVSIPDSLTEPSIAIRIYLPDEGQDLYGGVGLPTVNSFNAELTDVSRATVDDSIEPCPESRDLTLPFLAEVISSGQDGERLDPALDAFRDVHFYFAPGGATFPNADARYGATVLNPNLNEDHAVTQIRFRAPVTTLTLNNPNATFSASDDMRYWSLCMSGLSSTLTGRCVNDEQVVVDNDGFVNLVVGFVDSELTDHIRNNMTGITFINYDGFDEPFLLLRHLVPRPGFTNSFHNDGCDENGNGCDFRTEGVHGVIDDLTGEPTVANGIEGFWADLKIGDYSPVGRTCSVDDFIENDGCL